MQRRTRRGAHTVEFSLWLPMGVAMLAGVLDLGWFSLQEALLIDEMGHAARSGAAEAPSASEAAGSCAECVYAATRTAERALAERGLAAGVVTAELLRVPATGGACAYVVRVSGAIPHSRLFALLPGRDSVAIDVRSTAHHVRCE